MNILDQFEEFVNIQEESKEIDHSCWGSCSIGDFARSIGIDTDKASSMDSPQITELFAEMGEIEVLCDGGATENLYEVLNNNGDEVNGQHNNLATYGDLQMLLEWNLYE